jgi:hypothetical protein
MVGTAGFIAHGQWGTPSATTTPTLGEIDLI